MAFTQHTISGNIVNALGLPFGTGIVQVVATPLTSTTAVTDGDTARLGAVVADVPLSGALSLTLVDGPWRIRVGTTGQAYGQPAFQPITVETTIAADTTWGDLIEDATLIGDVTTEVLDAARTVLSPTPVYLPRDSMTGPATDQISTVATGAGGGYQQGYSVTNGALPADWPLSTYGRMTVSGSEWVATTAQGYPCAVTHRMLTDAPSVQLYTACTGYLLEVWVDGRPYASNPITLAPTSGVAPYGITRLDFTDARARLIEFRTAGSVIGVYVQKPYRCWKPPREDTPSVALVGDSYARPIVTDNTTGQPISTGLYSLGAYQQVGKRLGTTRLVTDGRDSSGFLPNSDTDRNYGHAERLAWLSAVNPDVVTVGSLINDVYHGFTDAQIIAAAVAYFRAVRALLPAAKIVLLGGFTLPDTTLRNTGPRMAGLTTSIQAALADMTGVYFLDLTTVPPFTGTGSVAAPAGDGNADLCIGADKLHATVRGAAYLAAGHIAPKMRRVLADNPYRRPTISGTLI